MTVSAIASKIYQEAKKAAKGAWNFRTEWSKAMKMAWINNNQNSKDSKMDTIINEAKLVMVKLAKLNKKAAREIASQIMEETKEELTEVIVQVETDSYNDRRYGKPWIATVDFSDGAKGNFEFGEFCGDYRYGMLEIKAAPGAIVATGQKDHRKPKNSAPDFYIILKDGGLEDCTKVEAKQHWDSLNR